MAINTSDEVYAIYCDDCSQFLDSRGSKEEMETELAHRIKKAHRPENVHKLHIVNAPNDNYKLATKDD